jgi:hypothetical protein
MEGGDGIITQKRFHVSRVKTFGEHQIRQKVCNSCTVEVGTKMKSKEVCSAEQEKAL